jgi:hypothetical protein
MDTRRRVVKKTKVKKEKPYVPPSWMIPKWEQGRITEEMWDGITANVLCLRRLGLTKPSLSTVAKTKLINKNE